MSQLDITEKVSAEPMSGCWLWLGSTSHGYGRFMRGSRVNGTRLNISAHRHSYEVFKGAIPAGLDICHKCDNPCCVNPDHLFVGSRQDNMTDQVMKGRSCFGDRNPRAKLTWDSVREIRELRSAGMLHREIAAKFGVTKEAIVQIISGSRWTHELPSPPEENRDE